MREGNMWRGENRLSACARTHVLKISPSPTKTGSSSSSSSSWFIKQELKNKSTVFNHLVLKRLLIQSSWIDRMTNHILLVYMWKKYYIICAYQMKPPFKKVSICLSKHPHIRTSGLRKLGWKLANIATPPPPHIYIYI